MSRLSMISEREAIDTPPAVEAQVRKEAHARSEKLQEATEAAILFALKTLSQRAFVALMGLFRLITGASVFALFWVYGREPSTYQIISLSIYALFVLALNFTHKD